MEYVLMPNEIELYIEALVPQNMKNIGTPQWLECHDRLQKLNQEALLEASALKEEQVKETLVTFGKAKILIHEAILINIWKHKVLPHLLRLEPNPESTIVAYSVLYHEAVCVALLELVMFHSSCCETLDDSAADLLEYLSGTLSQLLMVKQTDGNAKESSTEEIMRLQQNLSFEIGIRSLAIVRYLAENMNNLPVFVTTGLYSTYDFPMILAQLLTVTPWICGSRIYSGGQWKVWDHEQLGQPEAQVWLTLRYLMLDSECPKQYAITNSRRTQLTKLIPLIKPVLLDQLSPLIELKQWLCQLSVMEQTNARPNPILLEPVLEIKAGIVKQAGGKWRTIAEKQRPLIFSNDKNFLQDTARKLSDAFNVELLEKMQINESTKTCTECGKNAIQRCSRCKQMWYCSRACQVANWPHHKENCS